MAFDPDNKKQTQEASDRIEALSQKLYSPHMPSIQDDNKRHLKSESYKTHDDWKETQDTNMNYARGRKKQSLSLLGKLFTASLLFFVIALGISVYLILSGTNVVSSDNVAIDVLGPITLEGGDELELQMTIKNNNNVPLEAVALLVEYPIGARFVADSTEEELRYRESLPDIAVGKSEKRTVKTLLFGEEGDEKEVNIILEYRVPGSNAIFSKNTTYTVVTSSAPISISIDSLEEVNAGQEFAVTLEVRSNATEVIENVIVNAEYPFGFDFKDASPSPDVGEHIWQIGDLPPESVRTITIHGTLTAEDKEERVIRFVAGVSDPRDPRSMGTPLLSGNAVFVVTKPFIDIDVALDGVHTDTVSIDNGAQVRADISWTNNLDTRITNGKVTVYIRGDVFNTQSVQTLKGFFDSNTSSIVWDGQTTDGLSSISAGANGVVSFSFSPIRITEDTLALFEDEEIVLDVVFSGVRTDGRTQQQVVVESARRIRVKSFLSFEGKTLFNGSAFINSGPLPPKPNTETTYTIIWEAGNMQNDVTNARIETLLPSYVRYVGQTSPTNENVRFDSSTGKVVWDIGALRRGSGIVSAPRTVSFQVGITPSTSQVGSSPILVGRSTFSARDAFTKDTLQATLQALTTALPNDLNATQDMWEVVSQ